MENDTNGYTQLRIAAHCASRPDSARSHRASPVSASCGHGANDEFSVNRVPKIAEVEVTATHAQHPCRFAVERSDYFKNRLLTLVEIDTNPVATTCHFDMNQSAVVTGASEPCFLGMSIIRYTSVPCLCVMTACSSTLPLSCDLFAHRLRTILSRSLPYHFVSVCSRRY